MEQAGSQYGCSILGAIVVITFLLLWKRSRCLRYYLNYVIYCCASSIICVCCIPVLLLRPKNVKNSLFLHSLTKHITKLVGITWELRNGEILAEERGGVIIANHQSSFDILGMANIWAVVGKCAITSRKELFFFLPIGLTAWLCGTVFIDRVHPKTAHKQLEEASTLMKRDKLLSLHHYSILFSLTKHITKLFGLTWELRNGKILAEERGGVIVANHQSIFDILGMTNIWAVVGKCAIISKKETFNILPIGLPLWLCGTVFIDRVHPKTAHKQLEEASTLMKKDKTKLWIFPEGTRNRSGVSLLPFKTGAFRIAITCQVPLLPVVYSPYYFLDEDKLEFGKGKMIITALPAIPTTGLTLDDVEDLMDRTRKIMLEAYKAVCEEVKRRETM